MYSCEERKGKRMRYLEELEQKVLLLINKNQDLQARFNVMAKEFEILRDQNRQYEVTILNEVNTTRALAQEKAALTNGIEELLNSINALENAH